MSSYWMAVIRSTCVSSQSQLGRSALHLASGAGRIKVVKVLLGAGAGVNLVDKVRLRVHMCVFGFG